MESGVESSSPGRIDPILISIGIPTYNRADSFLPEAIQSALQQTYAHIEIIVSDNCSTDDTGQLVESLDDSRIRYYRQETPLDPEDNFNFCLDQAKGAYFLLLHDDDMIDDDFVATCLESASFETRFGLIRTGVRAVDEHGSVLTERPNRSLGDSFEARMMAWFTDAAPWYFCNTLFNTEELKALGGLRSKHKRLQDGFAVTRLCARLPTLDIPEMKASIRYHSGEITFSVPVKSWVDDFLELLDLMVELTPQDDKATIRSEGGRFFSVLCYRRAAAVRPLHKRWMSYWLVFASFGYRYPPPVRRVVAKQFKRFRSGLAETLHQVRAEGHNSS